MFLWVPHSLAITLFRKAEFSARRAWWCKPTKPGGDREAKARHSCAHGRAGAGRCCSAIGVARGAYLGGRPGPRGGLTLNAMRSPGLRQNRRLRWLATFPALAVYLPCCFAALAFRSALEMLGCGRTGSQQNRRLPPRSGSCFRRTRIPMECGHHRRNCNARHLDHAPPDSPRSPFSPPRRCSSTPPARPQPRPPGTQSGR